MTEPDTLDADTDTPPGRTFTEEQVEKIVQDRLNRDRRTRLPEFEQLREKAARADELEQAQRSELERAMARAETAEKARDEALARASAVARTSALVAAAVKAGAIDPDAVVAMVSADALTIENDGAVIGADDAVASLLDAKPYLRATPMTDTTPPAAAGGVTPEPSTPPRPSGDADGGTRATQPGQLTREQLHAMSPEEIVAAKQAGQLNNLLGIR